MPNIRDIAKRAGVSVTTVSRVMNDHPYVKEEKRERVLSAMKELKYTRNIQAVHLAKGYSNMLELYFRQLITPISAELSQGLQRKHRSVECILPCFKQDMTQ